VPIVTGAGGQMTDWKGDPLTRESGGHVVASSDERLHDQALQILSA